MILWVAAAWAATMSVDIDTETLPVGGAVALRVTVMGGRPTAVPRLPHDDGLDVAYRNQVQGVTFLNGQGGGYTTLVYQVQALTPGKHTIGPFLIELGTERLRANALEVTVNPPAPKGAATDAPRAITANAGFATPEAWAGQVVVFAYTVETAKEPYRVQWTLPAFDGLIPPRDGKPDRERYVVHEPSGDRWVDRTSVAFVPTQPGELDLRGALVNVETVVGDRQPMFPGMFDPFAPTRNEVEATSPTHLTVKALPPPPPDFSGLVGDFDVTATLEDVAVGVGASVGWTVTLRGDGTLEGFSLPPAGEVANARLYDDSPSVRAGLVKGLYKTEGRFRRQVVPTAVGTLRLPPLTIVWFSPTKGDYVRSDLPVPPIEVGPGKEGALAISSFGSDEPVATEPAVDGVRNLALGGAAHRTERPWLVPLLGVAALSPAFFVLFQSLVGWWRARPPRERPAVEATPTERLARLPDEPTARLAALEAAFRLALSRRAGVPPAALDRDPVIEGLPDPRRDVVRAASVALDRARYAAEATSPDLEARVRAAVQAVEAP